MIDIHSHILHGLDDGAVSLYTALEMAKIAATTGTTDIVATPHANPCHTYDPEATACRLEELQSALDGSLRIHWGCHLQLTPHNLALALRHPGRFAINGLNYVLVEFSGAAQLQESEQILHQLKSAGLAPIVVHPERNARLARDPRLIHRWVESGIPVQIASRSLTGEAGPERAIWCRDAIKEGIVHFVASDAHDTTLRPPNLSGANAFLESEFGADYANLLLEQHPRAVLEGQPLDVRPIPAARRKSVKWFHFGTP